MKRVLEQNLLLVPFCYETENCCTSIIEKKIFVGQNLVLASFWFSY